jgi:hypothetical protein
VWCELARSRDRPRGFLYRRTWLASVAHAPDPGVTRVRRLAPSTGRPEVACIPGSSRGLRSRVARVCPEITTLGPSVQPDVAGQSWGGLHELRWATARPDPAAGSQNPERGFGDEHNGRSRRWRCP